jgi:hypothetical protein
MESADRTGPVHYRTAAVGGVSVFYREAAALLDPPQDDPLPSRHRRTPRRLARGRTHRTSEQERRGA